MPFCELNMAGPLMLREGAVTAVRRLVCTAARVGWNGPVLPSVT